MTGTERNLRNFLYFYYTQKNMILFINPLSEDIHFFVIDIGEVVEVRHTSTTPKGKDYDAFPEHIHDLINRHNIDTIWCVT